MRPYLSWIEDLTTNQGVVGSNPTGRASFLNDPTSVGRFSFQGVFSGFEPMRSEGVKKTARWAVFSPMGGAL